MNTILGVVEKQKEFQELRKHFSKRLEKHMVEKFKELQNTVGEATDNGNLKLPRHHKRHKKLLVYRSADFLREFIFAIACFSEITNNFIFSL